MLKIKITAGLIFSLILGGDIFAQKKETVRIRINDSTFFDHEVIIVKNDTVNGKKIAVYASDTTVTAYEKGYYEGYQTGVYKVYFPTGKLMESYVYQKGKKNGDYSLYSIDGTLLVKGEFTNDLRDGYWAYRQEKLYGRFKDGKKNGKWKWYQTDSLYYVYKFDKDVLLSVTPMKNSPDFPEYIINP